MAQLSVVCTTAGIVATDLVGADGISVTTTTGIITISGFRSEFVSASGFLQDQISAGGVTDLNTLTGSVVIAGAGEVSVSTAGQTITISGTPHTGGGGGTTYIPNALAGSDGITVTSGSSTDTISGFYAEFVAASGALSAEIGGIDVGVESINVLTGDVTVTGSAFFPIRTEGQVITVSGADFIGNLENTYDGSAGGGGHTYTVTSDGSDITFELARQDGGAVIPVQISGSMIEHSVPDTVTLVPAGADTNPQENWVYLLESGDSLILTATTAGFPAAPHARVARVIVQTAATVQTNGPLKLHAYTDHYVEPVSRGSVGHIHAIGERIRAQFAEWQSGTALTTTRDAGPTPDDITIQVAAGVVFQLHTHATPALDTSSSDLIWVLNDFTTPYTTIQSLSDLTAYSDGTAIGVNEIFNVVIWGAVAENDSDTKLFLNLPSSGYTNSTNAINDSNNTALYTIPKDYAGVGWLLARLTVQRSGGGNTWEVIDNLDLRGALPSTFPGGVAIGGGGVTDHGLLTGLTDDDHAQYSLVDGTRAFTGTVGGITPTATAHLATKGYVDTADATISGHLQSEIDAIDSSVTLQDAYDNGTGLIATTSGKHVIVSGSEWSPYGGDYFTMSHGPAVALEVASGTLLVHSGTLEHPGIQIEQEYGREENVTAGIGPGTFTPGFSLIVGGERFQTLSLLGGPVKRISFEDSKLVDIDSLAIDRLALSANGSLGNPAIYWTTDTSNNTGFYRSAEDEISIAMGGTWGAIVNSGTFMIRGGSVAAPSLTMFEPEYDLDSGLYQIAADHLGFATGGALSLELKPNQSVNAPEGLTVSGIPVATGTGFASSVVSSVNSLYDDITLQGKGPVTITEEGQTIVVSGTTPRLLATVLVDAPSDEEDLTILRTPQDVTLESMFAVIRGPGSPSVTWTVRHAAKRSDTGTEVVTAGTTTTDTGAGDAITSLDSPTITGNSWVWLETTVTGGSPQELTVELYSQ